MPETTEALVRRLLAEDPNLDPDAIQVHVHGTRVRLRGQVRTQHERDAADSVAIQVAGANNVDNELVVTGEPI